MLKWTFFLIQSGLSVVFIELKCRRSQTGLADLKKHQTLETLLREDSLRIFMYQFFSIFFNSSVALAKIVECILFLLSMIGQTQGNMIL